MSKQPRKWLKWSAIATAIFGTLCAILLRYPRPFNSGATRNCGCQMVHLRERIYLDRPVTVDRWRDFLHHVAEKICAV